MNKVYFPSLVMCIGLFLNACTNHDTSSVEDTRDTTATFDVAAMKEIINDKNNQFTQAHVTGDTAFLNTIFSRDARIFAPNTDVVTGRAAIAKLNAEYVSFGINEFLEETTRLYGNENYLINEGNYLMRYGVDNTIEKGKFINIWKHEDGEWKLYSNIWNSNTPVNSAQTN